jgi:hypothetical protein
MRKAHESLIPTRIHPPPIIPAPNHHSPLTFSRKTTIPSNAVTRKFADVLVIDTFTVEGDAVNALVNSAHMMMLHRTFSPRQTCTSQTNPFKMQKRVGRHTPRTTSSMNVFSSPAPKRCKILLAKAVVCSSVVLTLLLARDLHQAAS